MADINFWQDKNLSKNIIKEKKLFEELINSFENSNQQLKDLDDLHELANKENNLSVQNELYRKY